MPGPPFGEPGVCPRIALFSSTTNQFLNGGTFPTALLRLRACLKIGLGAAAGDFGCGQGGEAGASPQRAVTAKPTQSTGKRTAARRVFGEKAVWLRCSSVENAQGMFSFVAPRHPAFSPKTASSRIFRQALNL